MTDKINGRTPEEIKKGLECCILPNLNICDECPYQGEPCSKLENLKDFLAYIQQLERERDAAVELLHGFCGACANEGKYEICVECSHRLPFEPDDKDDYWQWRGVQEGKT